MSAMAAVLDRNDLLSEFDTGFVRAVLEHRGVLREPSGEEFSLALLVLETYAEQCRDNPREADFALLPNLASEQSGELAGKVFLMFGVVRPSPAQVHKAWTALYGPLLCETCG
jgi:hypothetical protein